MDVQVENYAAFFSRINLFLYQNNNDCEYRMYAILNGYAKHGRDDNRSLTDRLTFIKNFKVHALAIFIHH